MPMRWRLGRRPALDGLRGIAILLVLTCHFGMALGFVKQSTGAAGVELFFVLSGFLITSLLIEEQARTGRVSLCSFYLRRARRLLPALLVMVAVVYVLARLVGSSFAVLPTLFYVANFYPASDLGLLAHVVALGGGAVLPDLASHVRRSVAMASRAAGRGRGVCRAVPCGTSRCS
jgi:peptidoglycan/LPS O-acetylase OafA/YrhL